MSFYQAFLSYAHRSVLQRSLLLVALALNLGLVSFAQAATDCNAVTEIPTIECQSLLELYNSTDGPNWTNNDGWNVTNTPCSWYGVACDNGEINYLYLRNNQLTGTIPNFSGLPNLYQLLLSSNRLTGTIPNFNGLPNLLVLNLGGNQLTGSIPDFSGLPNLVDISLNDNQLTGPIIDFSTLPNLREVWLSSNQLTGTIPDFSALPNLEMLYLYDNQLTGSIPDFSGLPNLLGIYLNGNQLTGTIPDFNRLPNLKSLYLSNNQLTETIPNFNGLPNLQALYLNTNQLTGPIPDFSFMTRLDYLYLRNNSICKDTNINYSTWSVQVREDDTTWQEQLNEFPDCSDKQQPPIAVFTASPQQGQAPLIVNLDANGSSDPDGTIVNYDWAINGKSLLSGIIVFITFPDVGNYTITLTITDNDGLTGQTQQTVTTVQSDDVPPPPPSNPITLILTNREKLAQLHGITETDQVMSKLNDLGTYSNIAGSVIQVENDSTVATAYAARGDNYDDKNQANAVAEAIKQLILNQWHDNLKNVVIVGDDRVIPFYRIKDGTNHPDTWTLTDDFYTDRNPSSCSECANPEIYIPDIAGGRLIETPSQIIGVIDTFLADDTLNIADAAVTGYDFIQDGAQKQCNTLESVGIPSDCSLIGESWNSDHFTDQILNSHHHLTSINAHADYNVFGTPSGHIYASDFAGTSTDFAGTLFYTVGCHSGQNVSFALDLPESIAGLQAHYIANTGFGWGNTGGVGLSEELMLNLTKELVNSQTTIGQALMEAKQQYFADNPDFDAYDEKISTESTLYGLPMYNVTSPTAGNLSPAVTANKTETTQENGLQTDGYSYTWAMATPIATASGNPFYSLNGTVAGNEGEPVLPKLSNEITHTEKTLHGVVFRGGSYSIINQAPPLQRFKTTTGHLSPERTFSAPGWYPSTFFTPNTIQLDTRKKEMLVATAGQYNPNVGQQRIFGNMDFDVYYHDRVDDLTIPTVYLTNSTLNANSATVTITTSDASGIKEVVMAYTDGKGIWNSANLTNTGETWNGSFAANTDTEFFIQSVDNAGNVAINNNDGRYFKLTQVQETDIKIQFQGLKTFYNVGNKMVVELVETGSRSQSVDLWFAIQLPTGDLLFVTNSLLEPFSLEPQLFKPSVPIDKTTQAVFEFEVPAGMGGDYVLYALYVAEGRNPLTEGIDAVARSNLVMQMVTLAN
ncbi:leucine rich repeat domain protein [Beggiatoa sp. PS]|nr:leucine rich repeat domain protein [Beggiatoa sp. PS]